MTVVICHSSPTCSIQRLSIKLIFVVAESSRPLESHQPRRPGVEPFLLPFLISYFDVAAWTCLDRTCRNEPVTIPVLQRQVLSICDFTTSSAQLHNQSLTPAQQHGSQAGQGQQHQHRQQQQQIVKATGAKGLLHPRNRGQGQLDWQLGLPPLCSC